MEGQPSPGPLADSHTPQPDPVPLLGQISHRIFHFKPKLMFFLQKRRTLSMFIAIFAGISFWSERDLKTKYVSCWRLRAVSCKEKHSLWLGSAVNNHLCSKKSFALARAPSTCRQKRPGQVQALHLDCPLLQSIRPHSSQPQEILGLTTCVSKLKRWKDMQLKTQRWEWRKFSYVCTRIFFNKLL